MQDWIDRLRGGRVRAAAEQKSGPAPTVLALTGLSDAAWSRRGFVSLAAEGYAKNPVVYRCVRLIAESAASVPFVVATDEGRLSDHRGTLPARSSGQARG